MQEIDFTHNVDKGKAHIFTDFLFATVKGHPTELSKLNGADIVPANEKGESRKKSNEKKEMARLSPLHGQVKTNIGSDKKTEKNNEGGDRDRGEGRKGAEGVEKDAFNIID